MLYRYPHLDYNGENHFITKEVSLMPKINPYAVLIIAVLGVSVSAIFVRFTVAPPEVVAFYRLLFTLLMTLPMVLGTKRYQWSKITRRDVLLIFLSALFLALHFTTWFASLRLTSVASSTILVNTQPFFVILFGLLIFKTPVSRKTLLAVLCAVFGTLLLSWGGFSLGGTSLYGDAYALIGAVFIRYPLSLQQLSAAKTGHRALHHALVWLLRPYPGRHGPYKRCLLRRHPPLDYLMCAALAFFSTILGHTLFSWCMKYLPASAVSLSVLGEPVLAAVIAYFLFDESLLLDS